MLSVAKMSRPTASASSSLSSKEQITRSSRSNASPELLQDLFSTSRYGHPYLEGASPGSSGVWEPPPLYGRMEVCSAVVRPEDCFLT